MIPFQIEASSKDGNAQIPSVGPQICSIFLIYERSTVRIQVLFYSDLNYLSLFMEIVLPCSNSNRNGIIKIINTFNIVYNTIQHYLQWLLVVILCGSDYNMPYKSTNKISMPQLLYGLLVLELILSHAVGQSDCARRPFPSNVALRPNESVIINLEEYFQGSNMTFKVSPNNSYSAIEPTYQCSLAGSQKTGKIITSRYLLQGSQEIVAALADSQFSEGAYSFYILQVQQGRLTTLNLPKQNVTLCSAFTVKMINSTHFQPTVDCLSISSPRIRILLTAIGQIGSPYADWTVIQAPIFTIESATVKLQLVDDVLVRGVSCGSNSYIQIWSWDNQVYELLSVTDRTKLNFQAFNIKSMKIYGKIVMALDYNSGIFVFRLLSSKILSSIGRIPFPFYQQFQYNPITSAVFLAKKGKIVSAVVDTAAEIVAVSGESYNVYKYQNITKMLITDSTIVALSDTTVNIIRRATAGSDSKHYNLYPAVNTQMIYTRLIAEGFTVLLLQYNGLQLQLSSCRIRAPFLKLGTPRNNVVTTVTATSLLDKQQSSCALNFTLLSETNKTDLIYQSGYRLDNEVVYGNQQGEGSVSLTKYGLGRDITYSIKTVTNSILQNETTILKALPLNCTFEQRPILLGGNISLFHSWQNLLLVQFSIDNSLRYYVCGQKNFSFANYDLKVGRITHLSYETVFKSKNGSITLLQAFYYQSQEKVYIKAQRIQIIDEKKTVFESICNITLQQEGETVSQIQIYNGLLFLVIPMRKQIRIHDLRQSQCRNVLTLNIRNCPWGYFAPQSVHFNRASRSGFRSDSFLIRQWDEVLTVRLQDRTSQLQLVLVTRNILPFVLNYSLIYTSPYLIALDLTINRTYTFYFDDEEILQYLRELPLRGAQFSSPTAKDRQDFAKLIDARHVSMGLEDTGGGRSIGMFQIDQIISGAMQYVRFNIADEESAAWVLVADQWRLIRASLTPGPSIAYLSCKANITYLTPSLILAFGKTPSTFEEYSENVTLKVSTTDTSKSNQFKITLSNVGDSIKRGTGFPARGYSFDAKPVVTLDDRKWFTGSIFDYEFDCPDCGQRIKFKQKTSLQDSDPVPVPADKFWIQGGGRSVKVLMGSVAVDMQYNHSVWPINTTTINTYDAQQAISITTSGGHCLEAVPSPMQHQLIALCEKVFDDDSKAYYLSLVSTASYKGFVVAQTFLTFKGDDTPRLVSKNDLIIVYSAEVAYVLALWQVGEQLQFIQLDIIDNQDISGTICSLDLAFNASSQNTSLTEILFSLVVTECSSNVYFTSFIIYTQQGALKESLVPNLHVSSAQNIDLLAKFAQNNVQIPSEAKIVQTIAKRASEEQLSILAVFDRFNSYQFTLTLTRAGIAISIAVSGVYYKYGNYEAFSAIRGDYLAIKYKSRLLGRQQRYGFYDVPSAQSKGMKQYHMFAGYSLQNSGGDGHEIPWIFSGSTLIHLNNALLERLSIANQLTAVISDLGPQGQIPQNNVLYTQKIQITAANTASARSAVIILKAVDKFQLTAWQIVLIVSGLLGITVGGGFALRWGILKYQKHKKMVPLLEDSLLQEVTLEEDQELRMSGRINSSVRGSVEPA